MLCRLLTALMLIFSVTSIFALKPVIVLLGPPGAGKGTFSQYLKEKSNYRHVSAGDIVRQEIDLKTPLGMQMQDAIRRGDHVDAKDMDALIEMRVAELAETGDPLIIDGFIHTDQDLVSLNQLIERLGLRDRVFALHLEVDDEHCSRRIADRLVCSGCGHVYNISMYPSKIDGRCDFCSTLLKQRINDKSEAVAKRINGYRANVVITYQKVKDFFPYVVFYTNKSIDHCFYFYDRLAEVAEGCNGCVEELVTIINFEINSLDG